MNPRWQLGKSDVREYLESLRRMRVIRYHNGDLYIGEYKKPKGETELRPEDIIKHGKGTLLFHKNTDIYSGDFNYNSKDGRGFLRLRGTYEYEGEVKNGAAHGWGRQSWADGSSYVGSFDHNRKSGKGVYTFANGNVYEGEWS